MIPSGTTERDPSPRCNAALDEIDRLIDAGLPVDRSALLDAYADIADELQVHFEVADLLQELSATHVHPPGRTAAPITSFGDYEVLEQIGRGAMGVVFKARQKSLNRLVALKFAAGSALAGENAVDRCRQEALALAQLEHPNIVAIHEVGVHEGHTYLCMEYVEGITLAQLLRDAPPTRQQAVHYVHTIATAIEYAHQRGIVHRDLKPANILVDAADVIRIADFGLGKVLNNDDGLTQTGQILGTLRYMPPELADGSDRSPQAGDIYSIGAILYELLSGRPPFWANSAVALIRQIQEHNPLPLRQLDRRIPQDLETICQKCLRKNPVERYATAGALADDLQRFLEGRPILARPIGPVQKVWRWCRRRPLVAGLASITLASVIVAIAVGGYFWRIAAQDRQEAIAARDLAERNAADALRHERLATSELARSELLLYASQISRAQQAWDDADVAAVWESLSACKPELRGWEYDYFFTRVTENHRTLRGHLRKVKSLAFTPDGRKLVSGSWDDTIKIWDVAAGTELLTIRGHTEHIESVAVSPDGQRILSGARDNTARIWDLDTGRERLVFGNHNECVFAARFTPDGARVVSGGRDKLTRIWDAETAAEMRVLSGHTGDVDALAVHPNGRWIASGSDDKTVRIWDIETGEELQELVQFEDVNSVAFSRDGEFLVAGTRGGITVWRLSEGRVSSTVLTLRKNGWGVTDVAFAPEGSRHRFLSGHYEGMLTSWTEPFAQADHTFPAHEGVVFSIALSDTLTASGGGDGTIKLWHPPSFDSGNMFLGHAGHVTSMDISSNGNWMFSGGADDAIMWWDTQSGEKLTTLTGHDGDVTGVAIGPDQTWVASSSLDGTVRVWNLADAESRFTLTGHQGPVHCVAVARDGKRILSGGEDATVRIWDSATGKELQSLIGHTQVVTCLAVSPSGNRFCTGSADRTLHLWDHPSGRLLRTWEAHGDRIRCVGFTPDGQQIVSGGNDRLVRIWDAESGNKLHTLRGHTDHVSDVAVSPDGRRLVSVGHDHALKIWDAVNGQHLLSLDDGQLAIRCVQFKPDGRQIISGGETNKLDLWDASAHYTDDPRP